MKLSIITINYNNAEGLERTIQSIISQNYINFEYIVIDGASSDKSVDILKKYADKITFWSSEPDTGIYNAMNKGIKLAKGEYVLFINSGDTLYNDSILSEVFDNNTNNADLIYGDLHRVFPNGHSDIAYMPNKINLTYILGNTIAHPSSFIKRSLFDKYGLYNENLKIVSDWAFFLKIIAFGRISSKHIPLVISSFYMDGISCDEKSQSLLSEETQKTFEEYFSKELFEMCTNYNKYQNFYYRKDVTTLRRLNNIIRNIFKKKIWIDMIYRRRINLFISCLNKIVRQQRKDPLSIPVIIISYNRLSDLKKLVSSLLERKHTNIVILDNQSTYPPLLEYYNEIKDKVSVRIMDKNYGHLVFWFNQDVYNEFSSGYHIITDSDIIPNINMPGDYVKQLMQILDKDKKITKVGFALKIDDIPDCFSQKKKVIEWEKHFWENQVSKNLYLADIDTTFALYPPKYKYLYDNFYKAIRVAGNFTAKHGGWYIDANNLTDEDKYYYQTSNASNSWKLDKDGNFVGDSLYKDMDNE